ncbi:MAG: adenylate cyclase, partial [Acidobacteria bacterium]
MSSNKEVEIKFGIDNVRELTRRLRATGFRLVTARTREMNTLYDFSDQRLRKRGELLRLRKYGSEWLLTHKAKGAAGRHKTRVETQTKVNDGG